MATYNIRYASKGDSGNLWQDRYKAIIKLIRFHELDIFGTQEGLRNQLDDLSEALPLYARYGKGRDDGKNGGEHSAIYYNKEKYALLKSGDFWLSQTPDVPSLGWDATCCNRICTWIELKENITGKTFYVFNAHFDHQGVVARKESSKLILKKMGEIAESAPAILTGDFNGSKETEWYKTLESSELLTDTYNGVAYPYVQNGSFNAFTSPKSDEIIDHIFITKIFEVKRWGVLTDSYYGKFPSDHFPVMATLTWK